MIEVAFAIFLGLAPFVLFLRWSEYRSFLGWKHFDYKQLIVDMIVLFIVLLIISLLFINDDSPPYDDFDPQDGGRWIH